MSRRVTFQLLNRGHVYWILNKALIHCKVIEVIILIVTSSVTRISWRLKWSPAPASPPSRSCRRHLFTFNFTLQMQIHFQNSKFTEVSCTFRWGGFLGEFLEQYLPISPLIWCWKKSQSSQKSSPLSSWSKIRYLLHINGRRSPFVRWSSRIRCTSLRLSSRQLYLSREHFLQLTWLYSIDQVTKPRLQLTYIWPFKMWLYFLGILWKTMSNWQRIAEKAYLLWILQVLTYCRV